MKTVPHDIQDRERFTHEWNQNFSVQASAGAGKTTLLVARVRSMAQQKPELLQQLVLLTYTNRAANEIRQRLRSELLEDHPRGIPPLILQGMSRMFIGTIHQFCLQIVRDFALFSGYPSEIEVHSKIRSEWMDQWEPELLTPSTTLHPSWISDLRRYELAWQTSEINRLSKPFTPSVFPFKLDAHALDSVTGRSHETIAFYQKAWRQFVENVRSEKIAPLPNFQGKGGKSLEQAWKEATEPLLQKIHQESVEEISHFALRIQEKRFTEGTLLFSDQIALAYKLLEKTSLRTALQNRHYRILLDEAQDTDPFQFFILTEISRPPGYPAFQWDSESSPPRPGYFCMVGDLKQSIYRDRADLSTYQELHHKLSQPPAGEALFLSQTFRCRPQIVDWVNAQFSQTFQGHPNQVPYTPLQSQNPVEKGQVVAWTPPLPTSPANAAQIFRHEAQWILSQIKELGLPALRARRWSEVAILAPTRKMLLAIQRACEKNKIPFKTHFDTPYQERIEYRWLTALLALQKTPDDSFHLLGILREIFDFSDTEIAQVIQSHRKNITLFTQNTGNERLDFALSLLLGIQKEGQTRPLSRIAHLWIEKLDLVNRLQALSDDPERSRQGLQTFLLQLSQSDHRPPHEEIQKLIDDLASTAPYPTIDNPDAIQLMTIKKSKGLQWDCVILPFLAAASEEGRSSSQYPSLDWLTPPYQNPILSLDKWSRTPGAESIETLEEEKFQLERQRLYYVACTRPRHSLILIDDALLWTKTLKSGEQKLPSPNAYAALHPNPLSPYPADAFESTRHYFQSKLEAEKIEPKSISSTPILPRFDLKLDQPSSFLIRNKITPSQLKKPIEFSNSTSSLSGGKEYGNFWHEFLEYFPWRDSEKNQRHYLAKKQSSPLFEIFKDRFTQEWNLFQNSPLFNLLNHPESKTYCEIPYTDLTAKSVEEGKIDLVVQTSNKNLVIDWKTDSLSESDFIQKTLPGYQLQIQSYLQVLQKQGLGSLSGMIYHTPSGKTYKIQSELMTSND